MKSRASANPIRVYETIARIYARKQNVTIKFKLQNAESGAITEISSKGGTYERVANL